MSRGRAFHVCASGENARGRNPRICLAGSLPRSLARSHVEYSALATILRKHWQSNFWERRKSFASGDKVQLYLPLDITRLQETLKASVYKQVRAWFILTRGGIYLVAITTWFSISCWLCLLSHPHRFLLLTFNQHALNGQSLYLPFTSTFYLGSFLLYFFIQGYPFWKTLPFNNILVSMSCKPSCLFFRCQKGQ